MPPKKVVKEEPSEFEKQRLANIAERDKLLAELQVKKNAAQVGLYSKPQKRAATGKPKSTPAKRIKKEEVVSRRTSSRLAGIQADSEVAREQEEKQYEAQKQADIEKRKRRTDDLNLSDITVNGPVNGFFGSDTLLRPVARPYERTFTDDEVRKTSDKGLKSLREKMNSLEIWDAWEPTRIKITPERIYSASFHPTEDIPIIFMGDKLGHLGIVDASQKPEDTQSGVKQEGELGDEDEVDDTPDPQITTIKPHTRTICSIHTHPSRPDKLFTGSYDSSIRSIDLQKQVAVEIYGPNDALEDAPVSGIDMSATDPNTVYFTTLYGAFGQHDVRTSARDTKLYQLSEKKIGGFTLNPLAPHYLATASLDRTMKLWDLRKITKNLPTLVGEHESRLSVSHAAFNTAGQVATSSYDDTIKIHSFGVSHLMSTPTVTPKKTRLKQSDGTHNLESMTTWASGYALPEEVMEPEVTISHNNQTGRWVTILRPQWQRHPQDGIQKLVIGNMNRFVDIYAASGEQLAQLGGDGITAVPAVAVFHPTKDWIASGTASGKLCLWM
ncbi:hypothetical protein H2198_004660 [Neophaeococcomyces mojaviensis]|uniref:Uncharacterized protein n=1 Tax=Neophaeococcomyces mojaviensis TaxID=3383035 RepID=A0ACC3A8Q2_9EURO|nr:hypothetical protein H2198_004660 [Knufia sp. JES_112]